MGQKRKNGRRTTHVSRRIPTHTRRRSLWPFALGGALLLCLVALAAALQQPAPAALLEVSGAPSLAVDRDKIDLGDVRLGEWVSASFEIANVGDQNLGFIEAPYVEVVEGC